MAQIKDIHILDTYLTYFFGTEKPDRRLTADAIEHEIEVTESLIARRPLTDAEIANDTASSVTPLSDEEEEDEEEDIDDDDEVGFTPAQRKEVAADILAILTSGEPSGNFPHLDIYHGEVNPSPLVFYAWQAAQYRKIIDTLLAGKHTPLVAAYQAAVAKREERERAEATVFLPVLETINWSPSKLRELLDAGIITNDAHQRCLRIIAKRKRFNETPAVESEAPKAVRKPHRRLRLGAKKR